MDSMSVQAGRMVSAEEAMQVLVDLYGLTTGELTGYARDLAHTVVVQAEQIAALQAPSVEPLRSSAYYYSFELTGVAVVDQILSAVATAGKRYHHTEDWAYGEADAIQAAANAAAAAIRALGVSGE